MIGITTRENYSILMANVFVYPSLIGMDLMTLEAMACGTPVISTSIYDIPDYLTS